MSPSDSSADLDQPVSPALATPAFADGGEPRTNVLVGPLGLRAGWGITIFLVLWALLGFVFFFGIAKGDGRLKSYQADLQHKREVEIRAKAAHLPPPVQSFGVSFAFTQESAVAAGALLAALGLSFIERRRFGVYGLGRRHLRDVLPGAAWGLFSMGALVGTLRALHLLSFDGRLLSGAAIAKFGLLWLVVYALVGLYEEFFFRGYVQFTLTRGLLGLGRRFSPAQAQRTAFWITAVLLSAMFLLAHTGNAGENPAGLLSILLAGLVFSYALWRTGSLWWGVGFHMTWDWAQSFLFGTPDSGILSAGRLFSTHAAGKPLLSGGVDGPEGSVLAIPVFLLMILMIRLQPQAEQPPLEPLSLPFSGTETAPAASA